MASTTFQYADVVLFFADQFQTLAVHDKTKTKDSITPFILYKKSQFYFKLQLNSGILTVSGAKAPSGVVWFDCFFAVPNAAANTWQEGNSIVVGMGDIRGINSKTQSFDLQSNDLIVTSSGQFKLHFLLVAKTKKTAGKRKTAAKKTSVKKSVIKRRKK